MKNAQKNLKPMSVHGFTQFKLTQNLLNNLSQFEITPTAKLVLLYLSSCYNPKKADMFPKQKTIAQKTGISERSVVRAVSELIKAGLVIVECKNTNRYKFTSKIVSEPSQNENFFTPDNLSENEGQNDSSKGDNLSRHEHEPMNELKKEPSNVEDYKILKQYAIQFGAKNIGAYIAKIKRSGNDRKIIDDYKQAQRNARYMLNETERIVALKKQFQKETVNIDSGYFDNVRERLNALRG